MSIPRALIRKLATDDAVYTDGLNDFADGVIKDVHFEETDYMDEFVINATAEENNKSYDLSVLVDESSEEINSFECTCPSYLAHSGACRHIVALLLNVENSFFAKNNPKQKKEENKALTDEKIKSMILSYSEKTASRIVAENSEKKARLSPVLKIENGNLYLGLKIGLSRTYIIKNIAQFYEDMKNGATSKYGAKSMFLHDANNFDEKSQKLLGFVMTYYAKGDLASTLEKKFMPLKSHATDKFLRMQAENTIPFLENGEISEIKIKQKPPELYLNIKKFSKELFGVMLDNTDYEIIRGRNGIYVKIGNRIYICDEEYCQKCEEFLTVFEKRKEPLKVREEDMTALYSVVFKEVSRFIPIKSREDLRSYTPKPMTTKLYLDLENEKLNAKLEFVYGDEAYSAYDEKREPNTVGDLEGELCAKTVLLNYLPDVDYETGYAVCDDEEKIYDFLTDGIREMERYAKIYISDSLKKIKLKRTKSVSARVTLESDLLEIDFSSEDFKADELFGILASYRLGKRYHRLSNGDFLSLEEKVFSDLANFYEYLSEGALAPQKQLSKYRAQYLDSFIADTETFVYEKNDEFKKLIREFSEMEEVTLLLPDELDRTLRNYQKKGVKWLKTLTKCGFCGILADDMGLGKTIQVISLIKDFKEENKKVSAIVVCPASLALNWESEINKFAPSLKSICVIGTAEERAEKLSQKENYDILITSYDLLRRDAEEYQDLLFDFEIVDEAQYIKNYSTQNAKAVKSIKSKTRFALTGTPIENNLTELWSVFDFLMSGYLYNHSKFRKRFEIPIIKENDEEAIKELKKMVSPFILRRLKSEVLAELPEKTETVLYAKFDEEQQNIYKATLLDIRKEIKEKSTETDFFENKFMILSYLMRLRRICCSPSLVYENYSGESVKLNLCMSLLKSVKETNHKILIFSQFTSMLDILARELKKEKIAFYKLYGSTPKTERNEMVNRFNEDETPVFLISLKAGGTGLNLTGADMVLHYDPWWNKSVENQATDRAYRIGQKKNVQVYKLIAKNSIEEKILLLQEKKLSLAESIIEGGDFNPSSLTKEELLALFEV